MKKHPVNGAVQRARALRRNVTEAEKRVWQILRSQQMEGYRFRRQAPIGCYIADFVCHGARLIIEIDGGQHDCSSALEVKRSRFLQNEGYRVLRFWNNEVLANLAGVYAVIARELAGLTPTQPSPLEGEGVTVRPLKKPSPRGGRVGRGDAAAAAPLHEPSMAERP